MTINEIISAYLNAKEAEREAKKQADAMKDLIMSTMGSAPLFETDVYSVFAKQTESTRLDTKTLYKDFPDIKKDYGKTVTSVSLPDKYNPGSTWN